MSLKVVLTNPPLYKLIEPMYDKPVFVRPSLALLASYLREFSNHDIKVYDSKFSGISEKQLIYDIETFNPDIVGISAFTYEINDAGKFAENLKSYLPNTCIVIGGTHVTALPEATLKEFPVFDFGFCGEADESFLRFLQTFQNGDDFNSISGLVYYDENRRIITNKIKLLTKFDIPIPAWDLFPPAKEYFIQTSRGCPFNCNFCFNPAGHKIRTRKVSDIIREIEFLIERFNPSRISFGDEAFGANPIFARELLEKMIECNIPSRVKWDIQTHVSFINEDIVDLMKRADVSKIELGVESGNDEILLKSGKGITKDKIRQAFRLVRNRKIRTGAFFILGHPNETKQTIRETIRFAAELNPTEPVFAIMVPFPGTKIAEFAYSGTHGYKSLSKDWGKYRKQINESIVFETFSITELKLYLIYANMYIYINNLRFFGLLKFTISNFRSVLSFLRNL